MGGSTGTGGAGGTGGTGVGGTRVRRVRPPPVPGTHTMALRPSSFPQHVALPSSPASSLPNIPDPESDLARTASPTFEIECFVAAVPHLAAMLLAPEGDPDALGISTPCTYTEAISVPPRGANIVDGMWIFKVKQSLGSPPAFKARYVAQGFSQRHGVEFFHTFSPTPKMTTLRVLLHVVAQRDYELHSLDFSTAFFRGSLHEEIWLRRPPDFIESFLEGT
ncbi:unnamed protein product [Closterium sp. NIES-53]